MGFSESWVECYSLFEGFCRLRVLIFVVKQLSLFQYDRACAGSGVTPFVVSLPLAELFAFDFVPRLHPEMTRNRESTTITKTLFMSKESGHYQRLRVGFEALLSNVNPTIRVKPLPLLRLKESRGAQPG
jgi:hypothetical protein